MINIPNNEIWYTTNDGNILSPATSSILGVTLTSNIYNNNLGVSSFSGNVTAIGDSAYVGGHTLTSIILPSTVTSIGYAAFGGQTNLTSMTILSTTPPTTNGSFPNTRNDFIIYVPESALDTYRNSPYWNDRYDYIFKIAEDRPVKF